jgi:DNA-binding beta-propeller fold protein YncE
MTVSADGTTLLEANTAEGLIHVISAVDGSLLRTVGCLSQPRAICTANDGVVFVADYGNNRLPMLSPQLSFLGFVGDGVLRGPTGVCADADVVVVAEVHANRVSMFSRRDGSVVSRVGGFGRGDGLLSSPRGVCFMADHRHIAVADYGNHRVSVFSVRGDFVRHVGVGVLWLPTSVACSAFDELVVADSGVRSPSVHVFSDDGELAMALGTSLCCGVAIHGTTVFAQGVTDQRCTVWQ